MQAVHIANVTREFIRFVIDYQSQCESPIEVHSTPLGASFSQSFLMQRRLQRVTTCWVVKSELLVGTRNDAGFRKLDKLLDALPEIPIDAAVWKEAARLGTDLRRHGMTVPLPDLLIAEAAIQAEIELWHTDDHFEKITKFVPLRAKNLLRAD